MKRLIPAAFAGAIVVSLLILLMIELIEVEKPTSSTIDGIQATQDNDLPSHFFPDDPWRELDCDKAASSLSLRIEASRSCEVDSDCALVGFGCPFGCTDAVNETQLESLKTSERAFQKKCHTCVYMCAAPAFEWRAVCVQSQCRVVDRRVIDFEKETIESITVDTYHETAEQCTEVARVLAELRRYADSIELMKECRENYGVTFEYVPTFPEKAQ